MKLPEMPSYPYIGQDWDDTARLLLGDWGKACYVAGEKQERALWELTKAGEALGEPAATPVVPPSGWKLVPIEPTKEMCIAAVKFANGNAVYKNVAPAALEIEEGIYGETYAAMLAASPSPRTPEQPEQPSVHPVVPSVTRPAAVDDGRDTRALSELAWTVHLPPDETCHYHHTSADTPFGRFLITWKGWKEDADPTIDETPWGEFEGAFYSVEEAQKAAAEMWRAKVLSCLAASPQPIDGEPV